MAGEDYRGPREAEEACRALWLGTHEQFDFDNGDILLIARTRRKGTAVLVQIRDVR